MSSLTHYDYTIAWICALPLELAAARVMLNKPHNPLPQPFPDPNAYELGELNGHYIVIACLPAGVYGTVSAASVVSRMRITFPRLQYALLVGIGGGVPNADNDIRLGDIVVSKPIGMYSGVVQYDYGKAIQGGQFQPTGTLNKPPQTLLMHIGQLEAKQMTESMDAVSKIIWDVLEQNPHMSDRFSPPEQQMDLLFHSAYQHVNKEENCEKCDKEELVQRRIRDTRVPYVHYGLIASGDQVIKDSETRDRLARQHGILCFEMEAAGLMDELPTLAIRGICDYCDTHKQKEWQGYAALTAAAFAKLLMLIVPVYRAEAGLLNQKVRHWIVPFARNPKFVGRQREVIQLEKLLVTQDGPPRVAITGLGGVGKTQVALEVAYRRQEQDKECSIFWVPCTSHAMIEQAFLNIIQTVGIPDVKPGEAKEHIKTYLSSERAGRWLLIFDNADDAEMWSTGDEAGPALEEFLPRSIQGRILFTSRNLELAVDLTFSTIIAIPDVDQETARKILEKSLVQKELLNDHAKMIALLEQLAYLPLAIVQASAYINKKRLSLSTYSTLLKETEQDVVELLSEDFRDPGRYREIQNPVMTTWLISFNQIQQQDQLAADYLSFMACIDPRKIPQSLLSPAAKKSTLDALGLLNAYSFISSHDMDISMHRIVHIAMRNWLRKNGLLCRWVRRVADRIQNIFPDNHYTNRGLWREYLPHAVTLVHGKEFKELQTETDHTDLMLRIADCLASDGRFYEAEVLYAWLMQIKQNKHGAEHPSTLTSMANLAATYRNQGRWKEAEQLEMQVMKTRKIVLGAEHPDTLTGMANLASTFWNQGRWKEAEQLEVQVMKIRKIVLGAEHPSTLTSMANLAATYRNQGRWKEAEHLEVQVMETRKIVLGAKHPSTLTSMANLAATYRNQGRWNEAEQLEVQVMEIRKTVLGAEHPSTLTSMANLAATYRNQGRWNEAEQLEVQVMETRKTVLGAEHPDTLTGMANLASTFWNQGRWNEAEQLFVQVMEIRKIVLGAEHPSTLTSMANLAATYRNQGRWNEAEQLEVQVMEIRKTVLGAEHPSTLTSMANLAATYRNQGRWNEAEQLEVQVMETRKTVLGAEHPDTLTSMANLARTWKCQGKCQASLTLMEKCFQSRIKMLGPNHPKTKSCSNTLSNWKDDFELER